MYNLLDQYQAAAFLSMSPDLLEYFTKRKVKSGDARTLKCASEGEKLSYYEEAELRSYDAWLREPWPVVSGRRPHLPEAIRKEIRAEAAGECALCLKNGNSCEAAHIEPVSQSKCNHPHNLLWLCSNHHTKFDNGFIGPRGESNELIQSTKMALLAPRRKLWLHTAGVSGQVADLLKLARASTGKLQTDPASAAVAEMTGKAILDSLSQLTSNSSNEVLKPMLDKISATKALMATSTNQDTPLVAGSLEAIGRFEAEVLRKANLMTCPHCRSSSRHNAQECPTCKGEGFVATFHASDARAQATAMRLPQGSSVAYRSLGQRFIGRLSSLRDIDGKLQREGVVIVRGFHGIGKTQVAVEYAYRYGKTRYPGGVFWIDVAHGLTELPSLLATALDLKLEQGTTRQQQLVAIWRVLERMPPALVILDNLAKNDLLQPWLPPTGSIHVLVTTTRSDLTRYLEHQLETFDLAEGLQLLNSGRRRHDQTAEALVKEVGGLPIALEILRDVMDKRPDLTPELLAQKMRDDSPISMLESFSKDYGDGLPTGHEKSIVKTISLGCEDLTRSAECVLKAMACLAPQAVPRRLLQASLVPDRASNSREQLEVALMELRNASLIEFDANQRPYAHRLILAFVRYQSNDFHQVDVTDGPLDREVLNTFEPTNSAYSELQEVTPHAVELFSRRCDFYRSSHAQSELGINLRSLGIALLGAGEHASDSEKIEKSLAAFSEAVELVNREAEPQAWSQVEHYRGVALWRLGERNQGLNYFEDAIVALRAALHQRMRDQFPVLWAESNCAIGNVLATRGERETGNENLHQAIAYLRAALEVIQRDSTPQLWAKMQNNLGDAMRALAERCDSNDLLFEAMECFQASQNALLVFGGEDYRAGVQNNLALTMQTLGERGGELVYLEKAIEQFQSLLLVWTRTSSPRYWARTQYNLGIALMQLGQRRSDRISLRAATQAFRLSLEERTRVRNEVAWASSMCNLGTALRLLGTMTREREPLEEALFACRSALDAFRGSNAPRYAEMAEDEVRQCVEALGEPR